MRRTVAALSFFGGYAIVAVVILLINTAAQAAQESLVFVFPMLGVLLSVLPANVGFAIGTLMRREALPARRCLACGALVAIVVAVIATPIGNWGGFAMNAGFLAVFVACVFLPRWIGSK
jgi:hypothetical protein